MWWHGKYIKTMESLVTSHYLNKLRKSSKKDASVKGYWNILKGALLEATERTYGWTKSPVSQSETWWHGSEMVMLVIVKGRNVNYGMSGNRLKK